MPKVIAVTTFMAVSYVVMAASAPCAWVVWEKAGMVSTIKGKLDERPGVWEVRQALDSKGQCTAAIKEYVESHKQRPIAANAKRELHSGEKKGAVIVRLEDSDGYPTQITWEYLCLPDTVDPRTK